MFTGLVQDKAVVTEIEKGAESSRITIETQLAKELKVGDSISINGVCLTAVEVGNNSFTADIMVQTLKLTSLKEIVVGDIVNSELAVKIDTRLGGHIVQGHVDGVGTVVTNSPGDKWQKFVVAVPQTLKKYIVNQGSICVDGVSLTVGQIDDISSEVTLWLIPETLAKTNLGEKKIGSPVNIEVDVLAKYVERLMSVRQGE